MAEWEIGDHYGIGGLKPSMFGEGKCAHCSKVGATLIWEGRRDINGTVMDAHVHRYEQPWWGDGQDGSTFQIFTYEPGHPRLVAEVYTREDAEAIVAGHSA